jgi:hypothetical protein
MGIALFAPLITIDVLPSHCQSAKRPGEQTPIDFIPNISRRL